jgi:DNA-binding MarR family transcriptional regulator
MPSSIVIEELLSQLIRTLGLHRPITIPGGETLSLSEALALTELAARSPLSQRELGDRLQLEKSSVSRLVAGLERQGWLTRERDPENRRLYRCALTEHGLRVVERWRTHWHQHHDRLLASLTADDLDAIRAGFATLIRAVDSVGRGHLS